MKNNSEYKRNFTPIKATATEELKNVKRCVREADYLHGGHSQQFGDYVAKTMKKATNKENLLLFNKNIVKIKYKKATNKEMENIEMKTLNNTRATDAEVAATKATPRPTTTSTASSPPLMTMSSSSSSATAAFLSATSVRAAVSPATTNSSNSQTMRRDPQPHHHLNHLQNKTKNSNYNNLGSINSNNNDPQTKALKENLFGAIPSLTSLRQVTTTSDLKTFTRDNVAATGNGTKTELQSLKTKLSTFYDILVTFVITSASAIATARTKPLSSASSNFFTSSPSSTSPSLSTRPTGKDLGEPSTLITRFLVLVTVTSLLGYANAGFACLSNPCVFGVCIDGLNSSYSCYCIDGYTGIQCQTNWDECWSGPCQNGGTCLDGVAYYNCTCPDGFSGTNCEENVDECMSNPCQNGGHCRDRNNGYTCTCQPGFLGDHCEVDVAVCETGTGARCQNGGECIEGPGLEFSCDCPPGWHGRICQDEINECDSSPCQNGGMCVDKLASYVCACPMGYTGTNCEEEILICADNPCQNNALCLMEEGVPTCYCVPDYHGEKCEYQYDECQLGPRCMNGGVCIDGVDTFSCSCPPLLTGMLCECLMIGEDSLDCNYTAPSTTAPPTIKPRPTPEITTLKSLAEDTTVPAGEDVSVSVSKSEEDDDDSAKGKGGEEDDEDSLEKPSTKPISSEEDITPTTISSGPSLPESASQEVDEEHPVSPTSESPSSYDSASRASSELPPHSDASGSEETEHSGEATAGPKYDVSGSDESSTAKPITTGHGTEEYTPASHSGESAPGSDGSTSQSDEDQTSVYIHPTRTIYTHHFTTVETNIDIEYSTPKYTYGMPTYYPTLEIPYVSSKPEADSHITPSTEKPSDEDDDRGGEVDHTPRFVVRPEIATTAAPFFTEYPEVVVTTKYLDVGPGMGHTPTTQAPTRGPAYTVTTISSAYDYESIDVSTPSPGISVTVYIPENRTYHPFTPITTTPATIYHPATTYMTKSDYETTPHYQGPSPTHPMPYHPDAPTSTGHSLYTEDHRYYGSTSTGAPPVYSPETPMTTISTPGQPMATTTADYKPIITYVPPTTYSVPTYRPTLPPTTAAKPTEASYTSPPPAYGTQIPGVVSSKTPVTESSSEEEESANTVGTGLGPPGSGGSTDIEAHTDCIKMGCYNGGTCVTTSEGSRCVCRFDRQGALCETPTITENAAFSGDSYVSHRIHKDMQHHDSLDMVLHVQLKVRTSAPNGLNMLAAAQGTKEVIIWPCSCRKVCCNSNFHVAYKRCY